MSSAPSATPSSLNCTPTTPTLSEALALTVVAPASMAPAAGDAIPTVGGVVSFNTVTVTGSDSQVAPSKSRATATSVCDPLLATAVFQETEYGAEVSSAPRLTPSRVNWTLRTVSAPTTPTPALTAIVPPTVELGAGAVMETIRVPSCADAGGSAPQLQNHDCHHRAPALLRDGASFDLPRSEK